MEKAESLWKQYEDTGLVKRCEDYALWTNPTIFPKHWMSPKKGNANLPVEHDYQSIGALLVKSASTKITSLLFPVRQPFFRIGLNDKVKADLKEAAKANAQELDDKGLQAFASDIEQNACAQMFKNASYSALQRFLALLLITGNALIYRNNKQEMLVYSLHNYVVKRDGAGTVLTVVLREFLAFNSLAPDIQAEINKSGRYKASDEVTLYTIVERQQNSAGTVTYTARQEIEGRSVGKPEEYPEKLCPFIPVYWSLANGDSYGEGQVAEFAGDFAKISELSRALTMYELEACTIINLVSPTATTDIDSLNDAVVGAYVQGKPTDIAKHESGEYQKIQQLTNSIIAVYQRLAPVFMYKANVRDAERVTKEEIRQGAQEVDELMGGVYSALSTQVHTRLAYLGVKEVYPELEAYLSTGGFDFNILVGLAALGRSAELNSLTQAAQVVSAIVPALGNTSKRFNPERIIDTVFQSFGLNIADYTYTAEELKQQAQQQTATLNAVNPLDQVQAVQGVING